MAIKGMDVEGGRQAASQITQGMQELEALSGRLTQSIKSFDWVGPDADRTRSTWDTDYMAMLRQVGGALQEFSTLIQTQAQDQEQVSA